MVSWKPLRNSVTTNLGTYMTLSSIWDGAFGENIYRLKVVNYFRKKISILDVLEGAKYASGRRMKAARYVSLYLLSGITVLSPVSLCFLKVKNPSPLRHLKFLALFCAYNLAALIVSSVLTVLLLSNLPLLMFRLNPSLSYFFTFFHIVLVVDGSFSGNLLQKSSLKLCFSFLCLK